MEDKLNLEEFIVKAKRNGWVGDEPLGVRITQSRKGSYDITYSEGDFHYHDSFVGFSDFCGMEHVTYREEPIWSMVYFGYLLKPNIFSGDEAVIILKKALSAMYQENKFLGGFYFKDGNIEYRDMNFGDYKRFNGTEKMFCKGELVYELNYLGGNVRK